jgi:hypothetical protein
MNNIEVIAPRKQSGQYEKGHLAEKEIKSADE